MLYCRDQLSLQPRLAGGWGRLEAGAGVLLWFTATFLACFCSPSQGSSVISNIDWGLPKPGVPALLSPELFELTEGMRSQHLLNFSYKTPALLRL